jgi:hypothetical protein
MKKILARLGPKKHVHRFIPLGKNSARQGENPVKCLDKKCLLITNI